MKDQHSSKQVAKMSSTETVANGSRSSFNQLDGDREMIRTRVSQANGDWQDLNGAQTSSIVLRAIAAAKARRSARAALLQHEMLRRSDSSIESSQNGSMYHDGPKQRDISEDGVDTPFAERHGTSMFANFKPDGAQDRKLIATISPIRTGGFSMHQSDLLSPSATLSPDIDFIRRLAVEDTRDTSPQGQPNSADPKRRLPPPPFPPLPHHQRPTPPPSLHTLTLSLSPRALTTAPPPQAARAGARGPQPVGPRLRALRPAVGPAPPPALGRRPPRPGRRPAPPHLARAVRRPPHERRRRRRWRRPPRVGTARERPSGRAGWRVGRPGRGRGRGGRGWRRRRGRGAVPRGHAAAAWRHPLRAGPGAHAMCLDRGP